MALAIDYHSLANVVNNSNQMMVYGWRHTRYEDLFCHFKNLENSSPCCIKKVFDCWLGSKFKNEERVTTLEGRMMERIEYESVIGRDHCARMCKSAIVNLVLENCKRHKEKIPLIPLFFIIDKENNPYPKSIDTIVTRVELDNKNITNKELRRIYKICHMPNKFISEIAKKTVLFVKLIESGNSGLKFEKLKPFWKDTNWSKCWNLRKTNKIRKAEAKTVQWRLELQNKIQILEKDANTEDLLS